MGDKEILDTMEDFVSNNYEKSMSTSDKAEMFEHFIDLLETRNKE